MFESRFLTLAVQLANAQCDWPFIDGWNRPSIRSMGLHLHCGGCHRYFWLASAFDLGEILSLLP
jgi:hypothetical protein